jgi:hypothetical protein
MNAVPHFWTYSVGIVLLVTAQFDLLSADGSKTANYTHKAEKRRIRTHLRRELAANRPSADAAAMLLGVEERSADWRSTKPDSACRLAGAGFNT